MDRDYWYDKWVNEKCMITETDNFKKRKMLFTAFPKANMYGFQNADIRRYLNLDVLARYYRLKEENVLYPIGVESLSRLSFVENKKFSNEVNDDISNIYIGQMKDVGISIDDKKLIDTRHKEFVEYIQNMFLDLYDKGYISYKENSVYYDKRVNKIYGEFLKPTNLPKINEYSFFLEFRDCIDGVISSITNLNCSYEIKKKMLDKLNSKNKLNITFEVSSNNTINIETENPEFLGGVAFIFLNPNLMDVFEYVSLDEIESVNEYLNNNDDYFTFSGNVAINPLTGREIPIFISTLFNVDKYLGIPAIDEEDKALATHTGLEYDEVVCEGVMINSGFINGYIPLEARELIINRFVGNMIASVTNEYANTRIILSQLDSFGLLFPFLIDEDTKELKSLRNYLPYQLSNKMRPVLSSECDIVGSSINQTINHVFLEGMIPFISTIYDNYAPIPSLFDESTIVEYSKWLPIDTYVVSKDSIISNILMPIIIHNIIENESGYKLPNLFNRIIIKGDEIDISERRLEKKNNNLIDMSSIFKKFNPDTLRLLGLESDIRDEYTLDLKKAITYESLLNSIKENPYSDNVSLEMDTIVNSFIEDVENDLANANISKYQADCLNFITRYLSKNQLSKSKLKKVLPYLFPLIPYTCEEINKIVFNSRYSIANTVI